VLSSLKTAYESDTTDRVRGRHCPLGATWDGEGVNLPLFSEHAERVRTWPVRRARSDGSRTRRSTRTDRACLALLSAEARPGLLYGTPRIRPLQSHAAPLHPNKLLLDRMRKRSRGRIKWNDAHFGYRIGMRAAICSLPA